MGNVKKDKKMLLPILLNVIEGLLSGSSLGIVLLSIQNLMEGTLDSKRLTNLSIGIALIFLLRMVLYAIGYTSGHVGGAQIAKNLRLHLGDKIKRLPLINFTKKKTGTYINVLTQDINNYENILTHKTGDIAKNTALLGVMLVYLLAVFPVAGIINLVAVLAIYPALKLSFHAVNKYGSQKQEILADNVSDIVEYINGIQTFRCYGMGGTKNEKVNKSLKAISDISYHFEAKVIPIGNTYFILASLCLPLSLAVAGYCWLDGGIPAGTFVNCILLPLFLTGLLCNLFIDLTSYKNLMLSKKSIDILRAEKEENDSVKTFEPKENTIQFNNVSFAYEKEPVLKKVNFTAKEGELTAIVGDSGSGKSTLLSLLSKYYEVTEGDITIGGISIKGIQAETVLDKISCVFQEVFLFQDTIENNIRLAKKEAEKQEIINACIRANCDEFIRQLKNGYDTSAGENGNLLSGGERQRISIARAILKDSEILLLDEATAALDIENELAVKQAITRLLKENKTVLMIAHNLSMIRHAHQILVLSDGIIVEQGSHVELLEQKGKYYSMWMAEQEIQES
jgi:ATP-binding cassette subfamily B protein